MKLKLTGAGSENYTGQMGVVFFENGLSKYDVMLNDAPAKVPLAQHGKTAIPRI
ncbi:hypothetical protein [Acinetobacter baumannii]|uniref:hypothetical protein n=1 Tax=Acinetobacter baumannii TaxID=470 RepID=UPI00294A13D3|nr:hypothetical protein [Acinetobacter baumannii]MDV5203722.1 hypothetical protein [Acinetobacter baumannii]